MDLGYTPFEDTAPAVAIASGAWLTTDGGAACADGKPTRKARYQSATAVTITLTFATQRRFGLFAVLGLKGLALGAALQVNSASGNAAGIVRQFANGSKGCFFKIPSGGALASTVQFVLPAGTVDIGELVALPCVRLENNSDWRPELIDPSETLRTRGAGLATDQRAPYRRLECGLVATTKAEVRAGGLANGMDCDHLAVALAGNRPCIVVPRAGQTPGVVDVEELNATAFYGVGRIGQTPHAGGDWHTGSFWAEELPA